MIRNEIIARVASGARLSIDFSRRTFTLDGREHPASEAGTAETEEPDPLAEAEWLYALYKHSVPSERSDRRKREYFKALPAGELEDADLMYGIGREEARAALELHLLSCIASGSIAWDERAFGKWFWRSKKDPDFVILRDWVEPPRA